MAREKLRDRFAAAALEGLLANYAKEHFKHIRNPAAELGIIDQFAARAYRIADGMLRVRSTATSAAKAPAKKG
jgi:hypothetical protein